MPTFSQAMRQSLLAFMAWLCAVGGALATPETTGGATFTKAQDAINRTPLTFVENKGQVVDDLGKPHPEILYTATTPGLRIYVTRTGLEYVFSKVSRPQPQRDSDWKPTPHEEVAGTQVTTYRFTVQLDGANPKARAHSREANEYYETHYLGHCPQGIHAASYNRVEIKDVYPGIDWVLYGDGPNMKYDFVVKKASAARQIRLRVLGATPQLDAEGSLVINTPLGQVREAAPVSFQLGQRVASHFRQLAPDVVGIALPDAKPEAPVVIDPLVRWSTYYGSNRMDLAQSCATDGQFVMVAGSSTQASFPVFRGVGTNAGKYDVAVVRLRNGLLQWGTFIGGAEDDLAGSIVFNSSRFLLVGTTSSPNLPLARAFQTTLGGFTDAFAAAINNNGNLHICTYVGGSGADVGRDITFDNNIPSIIVAGQTSSPNFPTTPGAASRILRGSLDGFMVRLQDFNGRLLSGTYIGGNDRDAVYSLSFDQYLGTTVFLAGQTSSTDLVTTPGAAQTIPGGNSDAFVTATDTAGIAMWTTYFGGSEVETNSLVVATDSNIVIAGQTESFNIPLVASVQPLYRGNKDLYVARLDGKTGSLIWSQYFGGNNEDVPTSITTNLEGKVLIGGYTSSTDLPISGSFQKQYNLNQDGMLVSFDVSGKHLWSSYMGGSRLDLVTGVRSTLYDNTYVVCGQTYSNDLPLRNAPYFVYADSVDMFVMQITEDASPTLTGFTPNSAAAGTVVQINGSHLTDVTRVKFGGVDASSFQIITDNMIMAVVGSGGSGDVAVSSAQGADSLPNFYYCPVAVPIPTISASGPTQFCAGGSVTLTANGGSFFRWSTGDTTRSIVVTGSGIYTVQSRVGPCQSLASAAMPVSISPLPAVGPVVRSNDTLRVNTLANTVYVWYYNGLPMPGGNAPFITFTDPGVYQVIATSTSGCSVTQTYVVSSVAEQLAHGLAIYPNPAHSEVRLTSSKPCHYRIVNVLGQPVARGELQADQPAHLDLKHWAPGLYVVQVQGRKPQYLVVE